ncbi:hypothetical protein U1Q18_019968 [Sarracenia purpurea var. burkii]
MGWKIWQEDGWKKFISSYSSATFLELFHILAATLLSLLLPVSFLLLSRLYAAHYIFTLAPYPKPHPSCSTSLLFSLFLFTNPTLLRALLSLLTISTLIHGCDPRRIALIRIPTDPICRHRLYTSWVLLFTLQVCVGSGIEWSVAAGIDGSGFGFVHERSLLRGVWFFLGLHETTVYWWRTVVKPVVDDTVFGFATEERWVGKVAMAAGFGGIWWWKLRDEVESLVVMVEVKRELSMGVGLADFVGCWLYYLTATIGVVRIVMGSVRLGVVLVCRSRRRVEANPGESWGNLDGKV